MQIGAQTITLGKEWPVVLVVLEVPPCIFS